MIDNNTNLDPNTGLPENKKPPTLLGEFFNDLQTEAQVEAITPTFTGDWSKYDVGSNIINGGEDYRAKMQSGTSKAINGTVNAIGQFGAGVTAGLLGMGEAAIRIGAAGLTDETVYYLDYLLLLLVLQHPYK